jgi:LacI family transcriptional regulator
VAEQDDLQNPAATSLHRGGRGRSQVTTAQIGAAIGLSQSAVSKILRNLVEGFSSDTVEKVRKTARQMGYRVNPAARAMRDGRFGSIGLLAQAVTGWIRAPEDIAWSIGEAVRARGLNLTLGRVSDEALASDRELLGLLDEWSVDGLMVSYNMRIPRSMFDLVHRYRVPAVWLNAKLGADCVHPDDFGAAKALTEHLIELGHRRIAYPTHYGWDANEHYSRTDRYDGYADAMRAAGLEPWLLRSPPGMLERDRYAQTARQLALPDRPSAIITYQNDSAVLWCIVARMMGLSVPGDLSVASFHQIQGLSGLGIDLTAMTYPAEELGRAAVNEVLQKVERPEESRPPQVIPFTFYHGRTTGPLSLHQKMGELSQGSDEAAMA